MDFSNRDQAFAAAQQRAGNQWAADIERHRKIKAEIERREAAEAEKAALLKKQTKGRLLATYTNADDSPTAGADYGPNKPEDLKKAMAETQANTNSQWANDKGVVGPTGSEGNKFFGPLFNNPNWSGFGENQEFAAQHDMQATDAGLQANNQGRRIDFKTANIISATAGVAVIKLGGSVKTSLKVTKGIFGALGFPVKADYYGVY